MHDTDIRFFSISSLDVEKLEVDKEDEEEELDCR